MGDLLTISFGSRRGFRRATSATSQYERGVALEATDPAAAILAYGRALAGQPAFADANNNLGRLLHDAGDLRQAESHYRLAICAERAVALYWFNLGVVLEDLHRDAEAIGAYEAAVVLDAGCADAYFNLARLYELIGRRAGDELQIQRAVRHLLRYRSLTQTTRAS